MYQERPSTSSGRWDSLFSLDQTRTFAYVGIPSDRARYLDDLDSSEEDLERMFYPKRQGTTFPIKVESLQAQLTGARGRLAARVNGSLVDLFDPVHVVLGASPTPPGPDEAMPNLDPHPSTYPVGTVLVGGRWTRLRTLVADEVLWWLDDNRALPSAWDAPKDSLTLTYVLPDDGARTEDLFEHIRTYFTDEDDCMYFDPENPIVKEVVFRLRSSEQEQLVWDGLRDGECGWEDRQLEEDAWAWRAAKIRCVVVGSE